MAITLGARSRSNARLIRYIVGILVCVWTFYFLHASVSSSSAPRRRPKIQHHSFPQSPAISRRFAQPDRQKAVKKELLHAWNGYKDHAWMSDSLMSLTGNRRDQFCGWSATLVDSLDTLWIMGLDEEFEEAVQAVATIDFINTTSGCTKVNVFESTIRYLGGMLAAYDLSDDERLLSKLKELGEVLFEAFNTWNGMPCSYCDLSYKHENGSLSPNHNAPLADVGSFYLELARLSQVTGDDKYLQKALWLTDVFERFQNQSSIPGLWPERVEGLSIEDTPNARFVNRNVVYSLGALSDSAYEYLVKAHLLLGGITGQYESMWEQASIQIKQFLLFRAYVSPSSPSHGSPDGSGDDEMVAGERNMLFSGIATHDFASPDLLLEPRIQHLACFAGGMYALSSRLFPANAEEDLAVAEALTNGCIWAYDTSPTGIMPETVTLLSCPDLDGQIEQCAWNKTLFDAARHDPEACPNQNCIPSKNMQYPDGYLTSVDPHYGLRPELIESIFVMYRVTADPYWRDVGWRLFQTIIKHTRTPYGHASLNNVLTTKQQMRYEKGKMVLVNAPAQGDEMESFWLAETLKYFYLLFSDPVGADEQGRRSVNLDQWVLNTEAHPFKLI